MSNVLTKENRADVSLRNMSDSVTKTNKPDICLIGVGEETRHSWMDYLTFHYSDSFSFHHPNTADREKEVMEMSDAILFGWGKKPSIRIPMLMQYVRDMNDIGTWDEQKLSILWYEPSGSNEKKEPADISERIRSGVDCICFSGQDCIATLSEL